MNILIIHPHFPSHFSHLAPALAQAGNAVTALTMQTGSACEWKGVRLVPFAQIRPRTREVHPWIADLESMTRIGEACMHAALGLKKEGFEPEVILAHSGWGESLFIKQVWPGARLSIRCDYFPHTADSAFDPEFIKNDPFLGARLQMQQLAQRLRFEQADQGMTQTHWQAGSFPKPWQDRLSVIQDGLDTDLLQPNEGIKLTLNGQLTLTRKDEVITFICRELTAQSGFHVFMRALQDILHRRPAAHVLIAGGIRQETANAGKQDWRELLLTDIRSQVKETEWARVHFLGAPTSPQWIGLLQLSSVHIQLSYPSIAAMGLLEAMSIACAIVGSKTPPLEAVIQNDETGKLVDFFDCSALANEVCNLLDDPETRKRLGQRAREFVRQHHDVQTVCLERQIQYVSQLASAADSTALEIADLRSSLKEILTLL